jgi:hypothetical protein
MSRRPSTSGGLGISSSGGGGGGFRLRPAPRSITDIPPVGITQFLTGAEALALRNVDRASTIIFRATCETFLAQRFDVSIKSLDTYLTDHPSATLYAAGSSMVQVYKNLPADPAIYTSALERLLTVNDPAWSESDLDFYVKENDPPFPDNDPLEALFHIIETWGYTEFHRFGVDYTSGFMHQNKIDSIVSFRKMIAGVERQIQVVVLKNTRTVEETIDNFDLTCCSVGYNFRSKEFYVSPDSVDDIANDRMKLRKHYHIKYSRANFILHKRVLKYKQRGFLFFNPPPLTLAIQKVNRSIRRLTMKVGKIADLIDVLPVMKETFNKPGTGGGYPFYEFKGEVLSTFQIYAPYILRSVVNEQGVRVLPNTRFGTVTPREYYESSLGQLELVIEKLETLKRIYESGDIREILARDRLDSIQKTLSEYEQEILRTRNYIEQEKQEFSRAVAAKRTQLLFQVPVNVPSNQLDRLRLHNFERDARVYNSAKFRDSECEEEQDSYTREYPSEVMDKTSLFKRAVYLPRLPPRAANADPYQSDDDTDALTIRYSTRCYHLSSLRDDNESRRNQILVQQFPDDRAPLSDYEIILVRHLNQIHKYERSIKTRQRQMEKLQAKLNLGKSVINDLTINEHIQILAGGQSTKSYAKRSTSKRSRSKRSKSLNSKRFKSLNSKRSKSLNSKRSKSKPKSPRRVRKY